MNAKDEFIELTKDKEVLCALLIYEEWYEDEIKLGLKVDYSQEDYAEFLNSINFDYDEGYGSQEINGFVWFMDGTWAERKEYDGLENWIIKECPKIPIDLA